MGLAAVVFMDEMFLSLDREKSGIESVLYYSPAKGECREKIDRKFAQHAKKCPDWRGIGQLIGKKCEKSWQKIWKRYLKKSKSALK